MHKLLRKPDRVTVHARRLDLARYHLCRPGRYIDPINDRRTSLRTDRRTDLRKSPSLYRNLRNTLRNNLRNTLHNNLRSDPHNQMRNHLRSYPSNTQNKNLHN